VAKVNQVIQEKLEHPAHVVHLEKRVIEVMLVRKVIPVMLAKLVHPVVMVMMVNQVLKETKENQLVLEPCKECQEKKEHQVFRV